jgi:ethanolaminephosphotransferase
MSGTASNYDVSKLVIGQVITGAGFLLASISAGPTIARHLKTFHCNDFGLWCNHDIK